MNHVALLGTLGRDPEIKKTDSGLSYLKNGIGVWSRPVKKGGKPEVTYFNFVAFAKNADFIGKYCKKNSKILIEGSLQKSVWTDREGVTRDYYEIKVSKAELGLKGEIATSSNDTDDDGV